MRHARSTWTGARYAGRSDPPLSAEGECEAAALGRAVAAAGLLADPGSLIVSSPLGRALDTARAVAEATGRPIRVSDDWLEADLGAMDGLTFDEVAARWPDVARRLAGGDAAQDWPGGEANEALLRRSARALADVAAHPGPVIVVGHGFQLGAVLAGALGTEAARSVGAPAPASILTLRNVGGCWRLEPR
ncbi:MAG: histidine phosphatase family protein [Candidatus Limnocylindrales bacterium]